MTHAIDLTIAKDRLTDWFAERGPGWRDVTVYSVEKQQGSGFSAEILFVDMGYTSPAGFQRRPLVVRRQPQSFEVVFGSDLKLQASMMAALDARGDVAVPAWVGIEHESDVLGAPFLVMGRVEGKSASQKPNYNLSGWLTEFTPAQRRATWANGIAAFSKLHAIDWQDGFTFLNRPELGAPGLDQYLAALKAWHHAAGQGREMPIADAALEYVLKQRPADADVCVLWGDPTPSNTMFNADGTVAALIDWELAALGPPELDLAWWLYFDDLFSRRFGVKRLEGLPNREDSIAIYEQASGRVARHMEYYDIVAALRMALVAVGAFNRQVGLGNIAPDNKSLNANLMTVYLAEKLGMDLPELGPDFVSFMRNLTPVEEAEESNS